jgi:hypothetical protein
VITLLENVASMDSHGPEIRQWFNRLTGSEPYRLCAGELSHVRRPRYYWCSHPVRDCELFKSEQREDRTILHVRPGLTKPALTVQRGCSRFVSSTAPV